MPARILILKRQHSAVSYYRQAIPARILREAGYEVTFQGDLPAAEQPRNAAALSNFLVSRLGSFDLLFVDRGVSFAEIGADEEKGLLGYHAAACAGDARMLVDFDDDFTCCPKWNQVYGFFQPGQEQYEAGLAHLQLAEMTTVTTNDLATRFRDRAHRIRVLPNVIDFADWEHHPVNPYRPRDPRVRLFYGGAAGHYGDLDVLEDAMVAFIENPPCPVRWIVRGAAGRWVHDLSRRFPERVVVLPWAPFEDYPAATAWGGFDLAIAPLAQHPFNDAKSNIKALEAAAQGIPFLASRVGPYRDLPTEGFVTVPNTPDAWLTALRDLTTDRDRRATLAAKAKEWTHDTHTPARVRKRWVDAVEEALAARPIRSLRDTWVPALGPFPG